MEGEQKGRKSQNLQFLNCKNVNIEKIVTTNEKSNESQKEEGGKEDNMLRISFNKSHSKSFEQSLMISQKLNGVFDGFHCLILIPDSKIIENL